MNACNGKSYIGSSTNLTARKNRHYQLKTNGRLNAEMKLFGKSNFIWSVLEFCSRDVIQIREQFWMDILLPEYNILKKAIFHPGFTKEVRRRIGESKRGKPSAKAGVPLTQEIKNKVRRTLLLKNHTPEEVDEIMKSPAPHSLKSATKEKTKKRKDEVVKIYNSLKSASDVRSECRNLKISEMFALSLLCGELWSNATGASRISRYEARRIYNFPQLPSGGAARGVSHSTRIKISQSLLKNECRKKKLSTEDVIEIKNRLNDPNRKFGTIAKISREYQLTYSAIYCIYKNLTWKHIK